MKIVILKKQEFAKLINQHRQALIIVNFLSLVAEQNNPLEQYFDAKEICKMFGIKRNELNKAYHNNRIKALGTSCDKLLYSVADVIELKCSIEQKRFAPTLNKIAMDDTVIEESVRQEILK